ncbi:methyltransferase [Streptomyces canus]|uniref:methyltransferase n=1 Tax=Streptomyces canus TaxID=58343 RepID=UPI00277D6AF0|nr:methyltransferase [Streptomyces canus]MDQ0762612.1 hypothetical protein [Streptomyces canus]MDQ1068944.1 hypothetical protein [Streptomyces canus]
MTLTQPGADAFARPADTPGMPPHLQLLMIVEGKRASQIVYALAELGIADHLADGPRPAAELAELTGADPDALYRLLRCAASFGVFAELPERRFTLTPMADALRSDVPHSQRDLVLFNGHETLWRPLGEILHSVRSGRPSFDEVFGKPFFQHLGSDPEAAGLFNRAMTRMSRLSTAALLSQADFSRFASIADIGGGHGFFLSEVLRTAPHAKGVLFDQPSVIEGAATRLADDVFDRITTVAGDFFGEVPSGHDAYLIKAVLHDWDDERAVAILRRVREATAGSEAPLFLCEFVLSGPNSWDRGKFLDIEMLLRFGGRERDLGEWRSLLGAAGFEIVNEPPVGGWAVIECRAI